MSMPLWRMHGLDLAGCDSIWDHFTVTREESQEGIGRVFYCNLVGRKIIMLHQFVKKTDKTPPKELAIANKRMKEWKNADT